LHLTPYLQADDSPAELTGKRILPAQHHLGILPPQDGHWLGAALTLSATAWRWPPPGPCRNLWDFGAVDQCLPGGVVLPNVEVGHLHRRAAGEADFDVVLVLEQALLLVSTFSPARPGLRAANFAPSVSQ